MNADEVVEKIQNLICNYDWGNWEMQPDTRNLLHITVPNAVNQLLPWPKAHLQPPKYDVFDIIFLIHRLVCLRDNRYPYERAGERFWSAAEKRWIRRANEDVADDDHKMLESSRFNLSHEETTNLRKTVIDVIKKIRYFVCYEWIGILSLSQLDLQLELLKRGKLNEAVELGTFPPPPSNENILEAIRNLVTCHSSVWNRKSVEEEKSSSPLSIEAKTLPSEPLPLPPRLSIKSEPIWSNILSSRRKGFKKFQRELQEKRERETVQIKMLEHLGLGKEEIESLSSEEDKLDTISKLQSIHERYKPQGDGYTKAMNNFYQISPRVSSCITPCEYRPDPLFWPILTNVGVPEARPLVCMCQISENNWDYCEEEKCE